jgi:hypothetical protein
MGPGANLLPARGNPATPELSRAIGPISDARLFLLLSCLYPTHMAYKLRFLEKTLP